jgi:hypothetical protein
MEGTPGMEVAVMEGAGMESAGMEGAPGNDGTKLARDEKFSPLLPFELSELDSLWTRRLRVR